MSCHNVLERGAGPSGYTKVSRPMATHTHTHKVGKAFPNFSNFLKILLKFINLDTD